MFYFIDYIRHNFILLFALVGIGLVTEVTEREKGERVMERRLLMLIILALSIIDCIDYDIKIYGGPLLLRITAAFIGYCLRPLIGVLSICMANRKMRQKIWLWIPIVINAAAYSTCFYSDICISFDNNGFVTGPLYWTVYLISLFYGIVFLVLISHKMKKRVLSENVILCFTVIIIAIAAVMDSQEPRNTYLFPILSVGLLFYYVYIQLQQRKLKTLEWELKQQEQQNQLMISQIQPHFMYNTLATVGYLCVVDPPLAEQTISQFSEYLRQNMNVIGTNEPIPFRKELEHTQIYTEIEKLRFDNIDVIYMIDDEKFLIPALTVQPIVENAIRHGIRAREQGVVEVRTWKTDQYHMIEILDNGVGFDTEAPLSDDRPHIGLNNVKTRLKGMVNGDMVVESTPDEGTIITISIPIVQNQK